MSKLSPQTLWTALINAGATPIQAAAAMGNALFESGLDPEAHAMDTNGKVSYGLWQENGKSGNNTLVTGNTAKDMVAQINFMIQRGGLKAASGTTVSEAASNFAAHYEVCQGCQAGGSQNAKRVAQALAYYAMAQSSSWTQSSGLGSAVGGALGGGSSGSSGSTDLAAAVDNTCAWSISSPKVLGVGGTPYCIFHKVGVRQLIAVGLFIGSFAIGALGVLVLLAYGLQVTRAQQKYQQVRQYVPTGKG